MIGDLTSYQSPWGFTVTRTYNVGGRVTQISSSMIDSQHPGTLVSAAHYNGAGGITSYVLGNNLTETAAYNGLVQPCRLNVNSSGTLLGSCTASVPSGNVLDLTTGFNYGSGYNGNVMSWAAVGQQTFNRSYTYDGVNRLYTVSAPGSTCSGLSWSYDQWGNRTAQNVTGGTCGSSQLTFNSYNHVTNTGFQYDAAGNMTHDASHSYTYDAENRITQVDGGSTATYGYDVDGRRVSRVVAGVETDYIYDLSGHAVATYGGGCGNTCWNTGFIYLNGQMVAEYFGGTYFVSADHLSSTRLLTGYPTASVVECDDYYPFGELTSCGGTSTTTHKFTGYERDAESGLDNAQARYNSSSLGRFMSPDPIGNFVADATDPQTWNMYTYVNNNPLAFVDPTGLQVEGGGPPLRTLPSWYDCQPQIFMRTVGNPFDAGTPYGPTDFFDTTSTFCGAGGDWGRHFVEGGGAAGRGGCPLNSAGISSCIAAPPPQAQPTYNQCMANFNNSTGGKVANFFSVLHMFDSFETLGEWFAGGTSKVLVVRTVAQGGLKNYGLLSGSAPLSTAEKIAEGSGVAGTAAVVSGTLADVTARASCQTEAHPELLGGWMNAPF